MRRVILPCLFVVFGNMANAQLTILPQLGTEKSLTKIRYNNLSYVSPLGLECGPQAGVRLNYKFKQGHGPFLGIGTTRSTVNYNFTDPESATQSATATRGHTKLRLEGGYQVSSKKIFFNKPAAANKTSEASPQSNSPKSGCSSYFRAYCGKSSNQAAKAATATPANNKYWVRIQPSAGFAFIPSAGSGEIQSKASGGQTSYEYKGGDWNTAFVAGTGLEFGKNNEPKFVVSLNYIRGIGNLNTTSFTTVSGSKTTTTSFSSRASTWNFSVGVPIALTKKSSTKKQSAEKKQKSNKCGQYKPRCGRVI